MSVSGSVPFSLSARIHLSACMLLENTFGINHRIEDVFEQGAVPNTPKGKTSSPKRQGSRSKRPNIHVTFESYQSLLFLDSKEILLLFNTNRGLLLLQREKGCRCLWQP